jgi:ABC-2 type transport system ATP-binding protein
MAVTTAYAVYTSGLTKFYGKVRGIAGLDLVVHRGEIFGLVGPNGAGKTTTIRLLLDLIRPTRGWAMVLGLHVRTHSREVRARVGYLPGDLRMYENLTGAQFLDFLCAVRGVRDFSYRKALTERLDPPLGRALRTLSRGNKQKIGIIQALMHRPELVLLDEPTSGLDPLMQQELFAVLAEYRQQGGTVLFSSHYLPEVERLCHRVGVMREGSLVLCEEISQLRRLRVRRLHLVLQSAPPAEAFAGIAGVTKSSQHGHEVELLVSDNLDRALQEAVQYHVLDLRYEEPRLEDIFMRYYQLRDTTNAPDTPVENAP